MASKQTPKYYRVGMFLYYRNEKYEIKAIKENGLLFDVVNVDSGQTSELSRLELAAPNQPHQPLTAGSLERLRDMIKHLNVPQAAPPSVNVNPEYMKLAKECLESVERVQEELDKARAEALAENRVFIQTPILKAITDRLGFSVATYYNRLKRSELANRSIAAIAWSYQRERRSEIDKILEHFLIVLITSYSTELPAQLYEIFKSTWEQIGGVWVDPERCEHNVPEKLVAELLDPKISIADIRANPDNVGVLVPVKLIGRSLFFEFYRAFVSSPEVGKDIVDAVSGEGTWDRMFRVFDTFLHLASYPLQYVFADHYCLDVFSLDKKTRRKAKRLWLTVLIDAYTRCIIGFVLLYEHPSIESILQAIKNAIWEKTNLQEFGIKGVWHGNGIPVQLFLDNAWAHLSYSLQNTASQISCNGQYTSIDLVFRPPYMGRMGALVERFFGTLALRIRTRLKNYGAIQSSHPRDVRNAAATACLLYEDVYKFVLEEIVYYQNSPHEGLNKMTPNEKWTEAMASFPPIIPPETEAFKRFFWREHNQDHRDKNGKKGLKRTSKGLSFMGMKINSKKLQLYPGFDKDTKEENRFTLRYDPVDLSTVAVYCKDRLVDDSAHPSGLRLPDNSYVKISIAERELAKEYAKAAGRRVPGRDWVDYLHELRGTIKDRAEEMRATRNPKPAKKGKPSKLATTPNAVTPTAPHLANQHNSDGGYVIIGGSNSDDYLQTWVHRDGDN